MRREWWRVVTLIHVRAEFDGLKGNSMISWLIGLVTGMIYNVVGVTARFKPEGEARTLKARWALSLGVWNSGGADDYYLEELDRFFKEDKTVLHTLETSLPKQSASFFIKRKKLWLAGFRGSPSVSHNDVPHRHDDLGR